MAAALPVFAGGAGGMRGHGDFTDAQRDVLISVQAVGSAVSLLSALAVIATVASTKRARRFVHRLVLCLALSDAGTAVSNLLIGGKGGTALCTIQAYGVSYFTLASVAWVSVIAYTLRRTVRRPHQLGVHRLEPFFHGFAWGVPLLMALLPSTTGSYGEAGTWCWIVGDTVGTVWRFIQFYVPLWIAMAYSAWVVFDCLRITRAALSHRVSLWRMPLAWFPAILLFAWTTGTINRIFDTLLTSNAAFPLYLLQALTSSFQGALDAAAFFRLHSVRSAVSDTVPCLSFLAPPVDAAARSAEAAGDVPETREEAVQAAAEQRAADGEEGQDGDGVDAAPTPRLVNVSFQVRATYMRNLGFYDAMGLRMHDSAFQRLHDAAEGHDGSLATELISMDEGDEDGDKQGAAGGDEEGDGEAEAEAAHKATVTQTYFTLFKSFVGLGVLALPRAMANGGAVAGPVLLTAVAVVSYFAMRLLLWCRTKVPGAEAGAHVSFSDVGRAAIGTAGGVMVDAALIVSQMGFATAYLIFIGHTVTALVQDMSGASTSMIPYVAACALLLVPLSWLPSLRRLAWAALLADVAIVVGLITVYTYAFGSMAHHGVHVRAVNAGSLALAFGSAVFTFEGIGLCLPMQQSMAEPRRFVPVLTSGIVAVVAIFLTFGLAGYLAYGEETEEVVTLNLPHNALVAAVQLLYCMGLLLTYPVMMFPAVQLVEDFGRVAAWIGKAPGSSLVRHLARQRALRTAMVVVTVIIAVTVPHFTLFINLIGSVACSSLAFIFPSLFYYKLHSDTISAPMIAAVVGCGLFGAIGGGMSLATTIMEFVKIATE